MKKPISDQLKSVPAALCVAGASLLLLSACQKNTPVESENAASASESKPMPTGIVKNAVQHTEQSADVTKWMEQAATKSAAQIAKEEKLAKEVRDAKDKETRAAAEARLQAAKNAAAKPAAAPPATSTAAAPATAAPAAAAPVAAAPAPAPAAAAPVLAKASPAPEANVLKVLSGPQPKYPPLAARAGIESGSVSARVTVEPDGHVSKVDIVKAKPPKYFDKEVIAAAQQWKYAPIAAPQSTVLEFNFHLE